MAAPSSSSAAQSPSDPTFSPGRFTLQVAWLDYVIVSCAVAFLNIFTTRSTSDWVSFILRFYLFLRLREWRPLFGAIILYLIGDEPAPHGRSIAIPDIARLSVLPAVYLLIGYLLRKPGWMVKLAVSLFTLIPVEYTVDGAAMFLTYLVFIAQFHLSRGVSFLQSYISNRRYGSPEFHYAPQPSSRHIALLQLRRRLPFRSPRAKLLVVPIEKAPHFEAISYRWGDPSLSHGFWLDGKWCKVPASVYRILCERSGHTIWLDAVCIDQSDLQHKAMQVRLMTEIYRRASRVVVSLGDAPDAWLAADFLRELQEALENDAYANQDMQSSLSSVSFDPRWFAVIKFLTLEYWTRAWIVQEIAVASKVDVLYGGIYLAWDDLEKTIEQFMAQNLKVLPAGAKNVAEMAVGMRSICGISRIRTATKTGKGISLFEILELSREANAGDWRDKIFAIQPLSTMRPIIDPDYTRHVDDIYLETAHRLLLEEDPFAILCKAGIGFERRFTTLPSWCPDWSSPHDVQNFHNPDGGYYSAATGEIRSASVMPVSGRCFTMTAHLLAALTRVAAYSLDLTDLTDPSKADEVTPRIQEWHDDAYSLVCTECSDPYINGQSRREAFWRTAGADRVRLVRPMPAEYANYYEAYRKQILALSKPSDSSELENFRALVVPAALYSKTLIHCAYGRKFAATGDGLMAVVPPMAKVGDILCVPAGSQVPFVLRSLNQWTRDEAVYQLVGECYIHGLMAGEVLRKDHAITTIVLN